MKDERFQTDERIQTTANHFAAAGYFICFLLMSISFCYRTLILKQHIRDFWDILVIWWLGMLFVFIAYASKGVLDQGFRRRWLTIGIGLTILILTSNFIRGEMHTVLDVGESLAGVLCGLGLVIGISYFLNRRWKRKEGIENEK
jgi:hypothetical protein